MLQILHYFNKKPPHVFYNLKIFTKIIKIESIHTDTK